MISSSELRVERGLDAMLIVYSLLDGHPASTLASAASSSTRMPNELIIHSST
jgi:hypothetical protein